VSATERQQLLERFLGHEPAGEGTHKEPQLPKPKLSLREIEVLQLLADGLVNREIARQLFVSEETVKSHVRHVLAKLEARSRAHAVAVGFRGGLIS
jgi:DNA-binding NarL/FixJ family response regulator